MPYRRRVLGVGAAAVLVAASTLAASSPHRVETVETYEPRPNLGWPQVVHDEARQEALAAAVAAEASRTVHQAYIERQAALQARMRRASRDVPRSPRPVKSRATSQPVPSAPAGPCVGGWRQMTDRAAKRKRAVDCWWSKIVAYGWNGAQAFEVMWCESKGDPEDRNPTSSATGLFQILHGETDAEVNIAHAFVMWQQRGWGPWRSSRSCWA